jgi:ribose transport system substrate-binding protein
LQGFHEALAEYPDVKVRFSFCGEYQRDVARREFSRLASDVREIDAVLCANDTMALGVLDALDADASARRRPLVVGVNALPEAIGAIAAGRMLATADFDAMKMSCIATEAAVRHLRGEQVPAEIVLPVQIVHASNCAAWDVPFEQRAIPEWNDVVQRRDAL